MRIGYQHERIRAASIHQRERHGCVGRMSDCALAFDDDHVRVRLRGMEHELFGSSGCEIGNHTIDRGAPTGDHDPRLSGRDKAGLMPCDDRGVRDFQRDRHLPNGAIVSNEKYDWRGNIVHIAAENRRIGGLAHVPNTYASQPRSGGELGIVGEEIVQSRDDL